MIVCPLRLAAPAALAALLVVACGSDDGDRASGDTSGDGAGGEGGDDGGSPGAGDGAIPPSSSACAVPEDCVAVAATCCECPTFAVSVGSEVASACGQVDCDAPDASPDGCPLVEPACVDFQCQLVCQPVATGQVCANGFDRDSFGCLVDACRAPPGEVYACALDDDCVEAPADCCGCELGGVETAVAASALDGYLESLGCSGDPACPGVDVCDAALVPRCIAQGCTLGPAGGGSPDDGDDGGGDGDGGDGSLPGGNLCGVPDFPPCPVGQACILNLPDGDDASRMGVGTCADL